jgi:hypothetical protein
VLLFGPGHTIVLLLRFNGLIRRLAILFIMGLMFSNLAAFSAPLPSRWRWSNPAPFGGNIFDMAYGLGLTVAVAERGQIFTSDDLVFWEPRDSSTTNSLRAVAFFGDRLVITGERGTVLYADSLQDFHALSLGTDDWLEGLAASTNLLVAVGDNGAIYTSETGMSWARHNTSIADWLTGVAWSQGTFVLVGESGIIATSTNGTNWTKRTSGTTRNLKRVAWVNNQFWVVGEGGLILTSPNGGLSWSPLASGATNVLFDAEDGLEDQVVVGDTEVRLRANNSMWSNPLGSTDTLSPIPWTYYNAQWEGSLFLLSGRTGMLVEGFKTNAANSYLWLDRFRSLRNWLWELKRWPEFYVTVGFHGTVMTSVDGIDWSLELVPASVTNTTFYGVGGNTNLLLACGDNGKVILSPNTFTNLVLTNTDGTLTTNESSTLGILWHDIPPPTTNTLQGIATFGSQFVLTGDFGTVLTSAEGTNWTKRTTPTANFLTGATEFPGGLVAVGRGGTLITSSDGVTWTNRNTSTTNWLYRVRYLGGRLIVVGQNGTILTSVDGISWAKQITPTTRWLNDVTRLDDTYYIVGVQGTMLASTNATNWSYIGAITEKSLYGVACYNGQLVAAGVEGSIIRSQVIPDLTPIQFLQFSRQRDQNFYLLSGKPDQRFTLDRSSSLTDWIPGLLLEFLDSSGTLLLLDTVTTNPPLTEFYRATAAP